MLTTHCKVLVTFGASDHWSLKWVDWRYFICYKIEFFGTWCEFYAVRVVSISLFVFVLGCSLFVLRNTSYRLYTESDGFMYSLRSVNFAYVAKIDGCWQCFCFLRQTIHKVLLQRRQGRMGMGFGFDPFARGRARGTNASALQSPTPPV